MSKRSVFTNVTPLPAGITRSTVLDLLHNHVAMIDLNPLVIERHPIEAPSHSSPEEKRCIWYSLTDRIQYLPGGIADGQIAYTACFHDLTAGLQTHVFAPLGVEIKNKWALGGSLPGEPKDVAELGLDVPKEGLWIREDVDLKCNVLMTGFVKKTLKKAHATLVAKLVDNARTAEKEFGRTRTPTSTASSQVPPAVKQHNSAPHVPTIKSSSAQQLPGSQSSQADTYSDTPMPQTQPREAPKEHVPQALMPGTAGRRVNSSHATTWHEQQRQRQHQQQQQHPQQLQPRQLSSPQQSYPQRQEQQQFLSELPAEEPLRVSSQGARIPNHPVEMQG